MEFLVIFMENGSINGAHKCGFHILVNLFPCTDLFPISITRTNSNLSLSQCVCVSNSCMMDLQLLVNIEIGPFPTSYFPPLSLLGVHLSAPLLSPINIPLGRPELMVSLGAEMLQNSPGKRGTEKIRADEETISV